MIAREDGGGRVTGPPGVTELLAAWRGGDREALERLMPMVYAELRRLARRQLARERKDHTLATGALVHEAYLRLAGQERARFQDRAHFFAVAAQMMRRVLVDYARSRAYRKRGGSAVQVPLDDAICVSAERASDVVALDEALTALAELDERRSRVVELRVFGGLSIEETAEALQVSAGTVRREWTLAKAWLRKRLDGEAGVAR
jgi:RNA polymerase sigma factor (TIGR02999 family)